MVSAMIGLQESLDAPPPPPPSRAPELTAHVFSEGGWLQDGLQLEHRPEQERMARAVAAAMKEDESLIFEAGTGVGKSLAYLIPGIIHAVDQGRQMIVSTHTIALQEQLDAKDLPLCRRVFSLHPELEPYAKFKSAVLVGKANYLCTSRLATALKDKHELFPTAEHEELQRIAKWAETSKEGLRHELNPPVSPDVWEMVNADSSSCSRKYCDCDRCFYQKARSRLRLAQVIIVNHSLLFTHLNAGGAAEKGGSRGILFPDDFVVLDEAHTVPEVATEHFGLRLSSYGTDRLLKYLFNPKTKRGLLQKHGGPVERQLVVDALEAAEQFFAFLAEKLLNKQAIVRVREPDCAEPWLDAPLLALIKATRTLADKFDEGREREELLEQCGKLKTYQTTLRQFLDVADEKFVYWLEKSGRRQSIVTLRSAPIDVAPYLREELLSKGTSVIMTSATLAIASELEPFQKRVGGEDVRAEAVNSPFDFDRNMRVFIAADVPLPSPQEARLAISALSDYVAFCTQRVRGGSLVLFTSYADMKQVASAVGPLYADEGRPFLMQGEGISRTELANKMRELGNAVLFGTESFWTGIDVPGAALSQVVVTRLPFEVPTHPILEARAEWIRDRGGNPFAELTLPDSLIKFRQGVGRLIRTATDRGIITILDSRILAKTYGRQFIDSLPQRDFRRMTVPSREQTFLPFA
ncbi:MAG TPA: helicase C-terminal domain-containing protein [Opitutaceae bacterium]